MLTDVVVVDDSALARAYARRCLEFIGLRQVHFHEAENGFRALEILTAHSGTVGLVVSDLNMPEMDGRAFLAALDDNPRFRDIPTLVLTSAWSPELGEELQARGARGVLQKPLKPDALRRALEELGLIPRQECGNDA